NGAVPWDPPKPVYNTVLSNWNQAFVDTVRDTGGNNDKRYLIFKAYGAKLQPAITPGNGFSIPVDPAGNGRLIFSFHYYIPAGLALDGSDYTWVDNNVRTYRGTYASAQLAFVKTGIPVLCGETSAIFQSARTGAESAEANKNRLMLLNLIGYEGRQYGIIPCLWDNAMLRQGDASLNEENHALFKRNPDLDPNTDNWGQPIDYTLRGMSWNNPGNAAYDDPDYGVTVINAFIDAVNGKSALGNPVLSEKLTELLADNGN
ncbi:MAG: glycoside hydrolase family 5 protein, partial [Treponema sp.]|nr:glycoside hydrolase family 5 protein [Treponema sp.]